MPQVVGTRLSVFILAVQCFQENAGLEGGRENFHNSGVAIPLVTGE